MDDNLNQVATSLQKLIELHRQLLEVVRAEREALIQADLQALEKTTEARHGIIEAIRHTESERLKKIGQWAVERKKSPKALTLEDIALDLENTDPKTAGHFRTLSHALILLIRSIQEENRDNRALIERSLGHIGEMKRNALKESNPATGTYTPQGQSTHGSRGSLGSRLISTEG